MPDAYTEKKLAKQPEFPLGSRVRYAGPNTALAGQITTVVKHETKGGIFIELDGQRAVVSPFSLTVVEATNGHHTVPKPTKSSEKTSAPRVPVARHTDPPTTPSARIIHNGQVLAPPPPPAAVLPEQPAVPARTSKTIRLTGLRAFPPTTEQCHALFHAWLRKLRRCSSRDHRQAVIDRFELTSWLRDRVPPKPGADVYKQTIYYATATLLNYPTRMPPPDQILDLIARRFPVDRLAVNAHVEWMINRLNADHAAFLAHRAGITTEAAR
jgi:hypothetical protein